MSQPNNQAGVETVVGPESAYATYIADLARDDQAAGASIVEHGDGNGHHPSDDPTKWAAEQLAAIKLATQSDEGNRDPHQPDGQQAQISGSQDQLDLSGAPIDLESAYTENASRSRAAAEAEAEQLAEQERLAAEQEANLPGNEEAWDEAHAMQAELDAEEARQAELARQRQAEAAEAQAVRLEAEARLAEQRRLAADRSERKATAARFVIIGLTGLIGGALLTSIHTQPGDNKVSASPLLPPVKPPAVAPQYVDETGPWTTQRDEAARDAAAEAVEVQAIPGYTTWANYAEVYGNDAFDRMFADAQALKGYKVNFFGRPGIDHVWGIASIEDEATGEVVARTHEEVTRLLSGRGL